MLACTCAPPDPRRETDSSTMKPNGTVGRSRIIVRRSSRAHRLAPVTMR
jgi:hypothetical protein